VHAQDDDDRIATGDAIGAFGWCAAPFGLAPSLGWWSSHSALFQDFGKKA
jgi:hypothetical protein